MDSIDVLNSELDYLQLSSDIVCESSDDSSRIKDAFNVICTHINNALILTQNYTYTSNSTSSEYADRIKELSNSAKKLMELGNDSMRVYDYRPAYNKFTQMTGNLLNYLEEFINYKNFKNIDNVNSKYDAISGIIDDFNDSLKHDIDVSVFINPATVKRICDNAISEIPSFSTEIKSNYMDITRFNNKISNIAKDDSIDESIKNEFISKSIRLTKEVTHFCVDWNKVFMKHYPMTKA